MEELKRKSSPIKFDTNNQIKKPRVLKDQTNIDKNEEELSRYDHLFDDHDDFNLDSFDFELKQNENQIKLPPNEFTRCIVEKVERVKSNFDLILTLHFKNQINKENTGSTGVAKCHLRGPWSSTSVSVGDVISVKCVWDSELNAYKVDKDDGFVVTNSDTLVSGTAVVGSLFCRRKAVLQERFRGIAANSPMMVVGSIVHELLQSVLRKRVSTEPLIRELACKQLATQSFAYDLYGCLLSAEKAEADVLEFVPIIHEFVKRYISSTFSNRNTNPQELQLKITDIQDIEENLWVPQLGLKGKVDVTVSLMKKHGNSGLKTTLSNVPIEIKTGRPSFSMEHKGQLILYNMMLNAVGSHNKTALLLYIRENILCEIPSAHNEQRDLIMLRNDLTYYLTSKPDVSSSDEPLVSNEIENIVKFLQPLELPDPIRHRSACKTCPYAGVCCAFAKTDPSLELDDEHPLRKIINNETVHLNAETLKYFIRWCRLVLLEEKEGKSTNYSKALWTELPEKRQKNGRAVIDLELLQVIPKENRYWHTFQLKKENEKSMYISAFSEFAVNEYVIVSTQQRLAIATGCIFEITKCSMVISLERALNQKYQRQKFIVDKYESQSGHIFNFTNLGLLLENNPRAKVLRDIILNKKQPNLIELNVNEDFKKIVNVLNPSQRTAALTAVSALDYFLIKGLPGTGKTQTLVAIIRLLYLMKKTVLVTSHTNSAVDNLLMRLKAHSLPMLRLGSNARINPYLHEFSEYEIMKDCRTVEELKEKYNSFPIVGVTCLGTAHDMFLHRKFDVCIVDESTQVMQPTLLRPLFYCEKFLLVGDPNQLPPLVRSREARDRGADESLFDRLDSPVATATLPLQYRMNKTINKLANDLTYGGQLVCATKELEMATIRIKQEILLSMPKWLHRILHSHIDQAAVLVDTLNCAERSNEFASTKHSKINAFIENRFTEDTNRSPRKSQMNLKNKRLSNYTNYCEVAITLAIVTTLLEAEYDPQRIGVIAPYRAQVELLKNVFNQHDNIYARADFVRIEVNTVDQYQGRDKDIIIYSCSKTGPPNAQKFERSRDAEILEDQRRLTVAITRAKFKLIIIGDAACLQQYTPFERLFKNIPSKCKYILHDEVNEFSWQKVFEKLSCVIAK